MNGLLLLDCCWARVSRPSPDTTEGLHAVDPSIEDGCSTRAPPNLEGRTAILVLELDSVVDPTNAETRESGHIDQ